MVHRSTAKALALRNFATERQKISQLNTERLAASMKMQEKNIKEAVFDRGGYKYHGRVKAVAVEFAETDAKSDANSELDCCKTPERVESFFDAKSLA